ncbi:MAG: MATE family efflux transporter, partial [Pyramidobacter sp.]|nr:MATE family efflux transporter [Pyramidobacter sp.]
IAAAAAAFPVQFFVNALAMLVAIGTASLSSRKLGSGDDDGAERALGNGFLMSSAIGIAALAGGLLFLEPLVTLTGTHDEVRALTITYLKIVFLGNPVVIVAMLFNNTIRSEGNTRYAMFSMVLPAVLNAFLDPLFIFAFKMGIAGAAWATVTGQVVMLGWNVRYYVSGHRSLIALKPSKMPLRRETAFEILSIGFSEFMRMAAMCISSGILMYQLSDYGSPYHIAAYGIMMKVSSIAVMPVFGIGQGMQPVVGYCYGAGLYQRARKAVEIAMICASAITVVGEIILQAFPHIFVMGFTDDPEVMRLTVWGVRILQSTFAIIGFQIIGTVTFQALGFAGPALFLSLSRQVIFFIPSLLILPRFFGITGVFMCYPVADIFACIITLVMLMIYKKKFKELERGAA